MCCTVLFYVMNHYNKIVNLDPELQAYIPCSKILFY